MPDANQKVRRLLHVEPWSASGPGWANQGVTATFEVTEIVDGELLVRYEHKTVYASKLTAEQHSAMVIARQCLHVLRGVFEAESPRKSRDC